MGKGPYLCRQCKRTGGNNKDAVNLGLTLSWLSTPSRYMIPIVSYYLVYLAGEKRKRLSCRENSAFTKIDELAKITAFEKQT
jgi:hypothetical protein